MSGDIGAGAKYYTRKKLVDGWLEYRKDYIEPTDL
jgi:hypothetical protein